MLTHAVCAAAILTLLASSCLIMRCGTGGLSPEEVHDPPTCALGDAVADPHRDDDRRVFSFPTCSFRPVTMAIVVLAAVSWLSSAIRATGERSRAVWFVPPLTALATNLHIFARWRRCG